MTFQVSGRASTAACNPIARNSLPWSSHIDVLSHQAATQPHSLAVAWIPQLGDVVRQLTYRELDRCSRALAATLQSLEARGERALLMLDNDPDYLIAFFGCGHAGAVAVTLSVPGQKKHLARIAQVASDADARFVLSTRALAERFRARLEELDELKGLHWVLVDEIGEAQADEHEPHQPEADDLAFLQYTSGSTGTPRGVMVRHADLVYQGELIKRLYDLTPQDRALSWLPLFHDMGLILGALLPLHVGFPLYLSSPPAFVKDPERWLRAIARYGITLSGGPDFAYHLCCEAVDPYVLAGAGVDLSRWEIAFNGAEPVRDRTIDRFTQRFRSVGFAADAFNPSYGLAEATLGVTATPRKTLHRRQTVDAVALAAGRVVPASQDEQSRVLVSSGRALADIRVHIVDPDQHTALPAQTIGEIWVEGTGSAGGYWRQSEPTRANFGAHLADGQGPFLRTGDLGFLDVDGFLTITGRVKDLIVVHGKNHYPSDVEQTAEAAHPALRPHFAAAFAVDSPEGEELVVLAEVRSDAVASLDVDAVARAVMRRVNSEHEIQVDEVVLLKSSQIPKTTSGKVQRARCRQMWQEGSFKMHGAVRRR